MMPIRVTTEPGSIAISDDDGADRTASDTVSGVGNDDDRERDR